MQHDPSSTEQRSASLPDAWIRRIFDHMSCTYGSKFFDLWSGQDGDVVRAFWASKLGGFHDKPDAIKLALEALDERIFPPTLPEFLEMCRTAARRLPGAPTLPAPAPDAEKINVKTEQMRQKMADPFAPSTAWAVALRKKYLSGERLIPVQIRLASEALGEVWSMGKIEITERIAA